MFFSLVLICSECSSFKRCGLPKGHGWTLEGIPPTSSRWLNQGHPVGFLCILLDVSSPPSHQHPPVSWFWTPDWSLRSSNPIHTFHGRRCLAALNTFLEVIWPLKMYFILFILVENSGDSVLCSMLYLFSNTATQITEQAILPFCATLQSYWRVFCIY